MKVNKLVSLLCILLLVVSVTYVGWGTEGQEGSTEDAGIMPISAELEEEIDPDVTVIGFSISDGRDIDETMPQGVAVSCMNEDMHNASTRPCVKSAKVDDAAKYTVALDLRNNSNTYDSTTNIYIGLDNDFFSFSDDICDNIQGSSLSESAGVLSLLKDDKNKKLSSFVQDKEFSNCEYVLSISNNIPKGNTTSISFELGKLKDKDSSTFSIPVAIVSESDDTLSSSVHTSIINGSIHEEVEASLGGIELSTDNSADTLEDNDDKTAIIFDGDYLSPIMIKETIKNTSNSVSQYNKIVIKHNVEVNSSLSLLEFKKEDIEVSYGNDGKDGETFYLGDESSDNSLVLYTLYPLEPGEELSISVRGTPPEDWGNIDSYAIEFGVEAEPASLLQGSDKSTSWGKEFTIDSGKLSYLPGNFTSTTKAGIALSESTVVSLSTKENPAVSDSDASVESDTLEISSGKTDVTVPTVIGLILAVLVIIIVAIVINKKPKKTDEDDKSKKE